MPVFQSYMPATKRAGAHCMVLVFFLLLTLSPSPSSAEEAGTTFIFGRGADSSTLDPAGCDEGESSNVIECIHDGLVNIAQDSTTIVPALAESWETSPDGKTWLFHIRKNVFFHDGTPVDAEAVVFSIMRQIDKNHPYHRDDFEYAPFIFTNVVSVEAADSHTVKFTLDKPYAPFLANLSIFAANIVSPAAIKKYGKDYGNHPVGAGPFIFEEWVEGDRIVLRKNPDYWDGAPKVDKLVWRVIPDEKDRLTALKSGDIHAMDGLASSDIPKVRTDPDLTLIEINGQNTAYISMNMDKKPFGNIKVRQAVRHAVNMEALVKWAYSNLAIPAVNPIPPNMWSWNNEVRGYDYDPAKAKQLLAEAGYPDVFKTSLMVSTTSRPYMPEPMKIARAVKANLEAAGIKTEIIPCEFNKCLDAAMRGEHEMILLGWMGDNGDPDNFLYVLFDPEMAEPPLAQNTCFYRNPEVHDLLARGQSTMDREKRTEIYKKVQQIIDRDTPWLPVAHTNYYFAAGKNVRDFKVSPIGVYIFRHARIE